MDEIKQNTEEKGITLSSLLYALKRNIWLILLVTIFAVAAGYVYVSVKKPDYTATEKVAYKAENTLQSTTQNNINAMNAFIGTIVDFCDEGVVVDRANFYYNAYLNEKRSEGDGYTVQDFIDGIRAKDIYDGSVVSEQAILASKIGVKSEAAETDASKFFFYVSYTDGDAKAAVDKVKILVLAFDLESRETVIVDNKEQGKYFAGIISEIVDLDTVEGGAVSNLSKSKVVLLAAVIGVVAGVLLVYVKESRDKTVKDKEDLEEIVGADVFSYIYKQEAK